MSVTLAPEVGDRVRSWIDSGEYPDADSVVLDALRLLEERKFEALRAKLQSGIDQLDRGEGIPFTPQLVASMRREAEDRLCRGESPNPDVCP